jgi:hypothetical protein
MPPVEIVQGAGLPLLEEFHQSLVCESFHAYSGKRAGLQ